MRTTLKTWCLVMLTITPLAAQLAVSHAPAISAKPGNELVLREPAGKPVARVNGAVLTDRDLLREMYAIFPYARQHNGGFPKAMEADIRTGALKMMVFEELVYQEARRRALAVPPAKMERALADFRKQFKSPDVYREFLKVECNNSQRALRAKVERSLLIDQLLDLEVKNRTGVSLEQAKNYYLRRTEGACHGPNVTNNR